MFVLPTIAGLSFAIYAKHQRQQEAQEELMAIQAGLVEEQHAIAMQLANLTQVPDSIQQNLQNFKSPEQVIARLQNPLVPQMNPNGGGGGYHEIEDASDFMFFFVQANDDDVRKLFARMQELYPHTTRITQFQILNLLARLPEFAPDRLDAIAGEVKAFVEPIRESKNQTLAKQAEAVWKTFDFDSTSGAQP